MGVELDLLTEDETIAHVLAGLDAGEGGWLMTPNVDILRRLHRDPDLAALARRADLVVVDGMPLVWALRALDEPIVERVAGSSLLMTLCAAAAPAGRSVFLLGGAPGVAERAAGNLVAAHPDLVVAGTCSPPFGFERDASEIARVAALVQEADPDLVFVGLGCPKQERLIVALRETMPDRWYFATGASIDFAAGEFRRAPQWVQRAGLEWAYRLSQEPVRLFRRYLIEDLPFAARLAAHVARRRLRP